MEPRKLYRIASAAKRTGVARSTIKSAVERGEIKSFKTGCGLPLVALTDVYRWYGKSNERKRGPKPAPTKKAS